MAASRSGPYDHLQYVGVYQQFWRLPDILYLDAGPATIRYLLGRQYPDLPTIFHRDVLRASHGCGILPIHVNGGRDVGGL